MANPFIKAWKYLMAKFDYTVEQDADPAIQIEQAIAEVKRHHQEPAGGNYYRESASTGDEARSPAI